MSRKSRLAESRVRRLAKRVVAAGLRAVLRCSGRRAGVALLYHGIDDRPEHPRDVLVPRVRSRLFEEHVEHLRRRYEVVTASELPAAVARRRRGRRFPVAITFDDEHHRNRSVAAPTLERAGLRATFYLTGFSMSEPRRFWWERLQAAYDEELVDESLLSSMPAPVARAARTGSIRDTGDAVTQLPPAQRLMVWRALGERVGPDPEESGMRREDIRALAVAGHEIGFHTLSHDFLPLLDQEALEAAMVDGRDDLAAAAGAPLTTLAYPSGGVDDRVATAARQAGFRFAYTTEHIPVNVASDSWRLGRISIPYGNVDQLALNIARTLARRPPVEEAPRTAGSPRPAWA